MKWKHRDICYMPEADLKIILQLTLYASQKPYEKVDIIINLIF